MRILSVVGARPQFVKLAPVNDALAGRAEHVIVHTGQHYDEVMSDVFFRDLNIPTPNLNLAIGSSSHGVQTGAMLGSLERAFEEYVPDWVLVYGDTNSTLAAAIAGVKMHIPVAHLEAGLRSFNRRMPEEHNRVLTDHAADLLLAPTRIAMDHLEREGLADRSELVGDVMTDVLFRVRDGLVKNPVALFADFEPGSYYVSTIHRPDNTDFRGQLSAIMHGLSRLDRPVLLLAHPRLRASARDLGVDLEQGAIRVVDPLPYPDLVSAVAKSAGVITDSGGLQKEAFLLRVPCTTIRTETEWVETVDLGWNVLVSTSVDELASLVQRDAPEPTNATPYGDGHAASRVVSRLLEQA
ncbi:non-hydrolyzing UDP-N-acetylglucosamine 2-epimerase [Cryobacterium sp. Y50]|uniref:non-hydrolyzing UDP-N-acetylglucosamine 2-epimerase n=1 Tax=Cryobacterium sp. Y50 TaxID=2048286 RepID=UPI000CE4FC5F|nr:UDP-N-acetylglucosamine 2-epimerase (non-hydrolyzing) [Cryobacterium sp. Y50]